MPWACASAVSAASSAFPRSWLRHASTTAGAGLCFWNLLRNAAPLPCYAMPLGNGNIQFTKARSSKHSLTCSASLC